MWTFLFLSSIGAIYLHYRRNRWARRLARDQRAHIVAMIVIKKRPDNQLLFEQVVAIDPEKHISAIYWGVDPYRLYSQKVRDLIGK